MQIHDAHRLAVVVHVQLRDLREFLNLFFFFNDPATTEIYTLSLHDALPISYGRARRSGDRDAEPMLTDPNNAKIVDAKTVDAKVVDAKTALDRIVIPQEVLDRIAGIAPRSSLIITDEALSSETGKGTDFVVLLSGEPQGG